MQRGLTVAAGCLLAMWLAACQCQPTRPAQRIAVTSLASSVVTNDPAHALCQSFVLTPHDASTFFRTATEISGPEFHDRSVILPCRYEGSLTIDGEAWRFSINAGGAGNLYRAAGIRHRYLCEQRCQKVLARAFGAY